MRTSRRSQIFRVRGNLAAFYHVTQESPISISTLSPILIAVLSAFCRLVEIWPCYTTAQNEPPSKALLITPNTQKDLSTSPRFGTRPFWGGFGGMGVTPVDVKGVLQVNINPILHRPGAIVDEINGQLNGLGGMRMGMGSLDAVMGEDGRVARSYAYSNAKGLEMGMGNIPLMVWHQASNPRISHHLASSPSKSLGEKNANAYPSLLCLPRLGLGLVERFISQNRCRKKTPNFLGSRPDDECDIIREWQEKMRCPENLRRGACGICSFVVPRTNYLRHLIWRPTNKLSCIREVFWSVMFGMTYGCVTRRVLLIFFGIAATNGFLLMCTVLFFVRLLSISCPFPTLAHHAFIACLPCSGLRLLVPAPWPPVGGHITKIPSLKFDR